MASAIQNFRDEAERVALLGLGGGYLLIALGGAIEYSSDPSIALVVFTFIAASGVVLVAGGYWLPRMDVSPEFYSGIFWRSLAGIGISAVALSLYHLQPDTGLLTPRRAFSILTGFSGVAGYAVGVLDAKVKTRERDLQRKNQQLDHVKARLKESNERLEQFAYAASHDLKEPLRMVTNYLRLLERRYGDELDEDGREFLEYAVDGGEQMKAMIEGLLEYSRVETRGDTVESVDLNAVLSDVRRSLELQIRDADVEVACEELPQVYGNKSQLRRLFQNLLSNAIQYNDSHPPRVDVSAERAGDEWAISVRDNGIGIEPADRDRIFEVFERLHTDEEIPGTGMGLALCKRIVESHGGEIEVDSTPGEGTTVTVTLPDSPT